ncbi:monocarboxylate transporter 11-like [Anneissia japonica]|uniref:monocarboxylate transporter 11-like n=1 Tax=Anneissia japonica TaxID=1529436 RepID=UPI0014257A05|nr:monocarboxylate transporter 11-like [Anneissia japonica]
MCGKGFAETSVPGAVSIALFSCSSVVVTLLFQTLGHRMTVALGVSLCCLGLLISSFVERIVVFCFTYGVLYGFGYNLSHVTIIDMILRNFDRRNASRATCTAFCGASVGVLLAPCLDWLYLEYSWRGSLRILCVLYAIIGYLSALVMVEMNPAVVKHSDEKEENYITQEAVPQTSFIARCIDVFRRRDFLFAAPGCLLAATAMSFTFIGIGSFLVDAGMSNPSISLTLALMGLADLCGRIGSAIFSDILPISRTLQYGVMNFIAAVPSVCLPVITSSNGRMAALIETI